MKVQTQTPLSVLRGHSHAILLVPSDGVLSPSLRESIQNSGCKVELIGHALLAMAAVVWHEANVREPNSRETTAFVAADVDIDDLNPLFNAIRNRLPHVSTWVFQGELALLVAAAQPRHELGISGAAVAPIAHADFETKPSARHMPKAAEKSGTRTEAGLRSDALPPSRVPPQLKLAEGSAFLDPTADAAARLLADRALTDRAHDDRELDDIERRFGRGNQTDTERARAEGFDREDEEEPAPSAVRLTPEEIAMLMGDDHPGNALPPRHDRGPDAPRPLTGRETRAESRAESRAEDGAEGGTSGGTSGGKGTERGSER